MTQPTPLTEILYVSAVSLGGTIGCLGRYGIGRLVGGFAAVQHFPWHTFGINALGSFVLGLAVVSIKHHPQPAWFLLLGTGFCGGFTTFSTFSVETLELLERDRPVAAAVYSLGSVLTGLAAAGLAMKLAR
jgi:CrcB protein